MIIGNSLPPVWLLWITVVMYALYMLFGLGELFSGKSMLASLFSVILTGVKVYLFWMVLQGGILAYRSVGVWLLALMVLGIFSHKAKKKDLPKAKGTVKSPKNAKKTKKAKKSKK